MTYPLVINPQQYPVQDWGSGRVSYMTPEQQQSQQQQQGMNPLQGLQMYNDISGMFGGGSAAGGAAGIGSAASGVSSGVTAGGGTYLTGSGLAGSAGAINTTAGAAGGASAAGGGAAGGGIAAAGPWAALAAVIMVNEEEARKAGRRDEDRSSRMVDQLSGAVLEQDMDYYGDKVGGFGGEILKGVGKLGNPEGTWNMIKDIF